MSPQDLAPIKEALQQAAPGPWQAKQMNRPDDDPWFFVLDAEGRGPVVETAPGAIVQTKYLVTPEAEQRANVELIAHAPEWLGALVQAVEDQQRQLESAPWKASYQEAMREVAQLRADGQRLRQCLKDLLDAVD